MIISLTGILLMLTASASLLTIIEFIDPPTECKVGETITLKYNADCYNFNYLKIVFYAAKDQYFNTPRILLEEKIIKKAGEGSIQYTIPKEAGVSLLVRITLYEGDLEGEEWTESGSFLHIGITDGTQRAEWLTESPVSKAGWNEKNGKKYYGNSKAEMVYGLETINKHTYFFDEGTGEMVTGWFKYGSEWQYANDNGIVVTLDYEEFAKIHKLTVPDYVDSLNFDLFVMGRRHHQRDLTIVCSPGSYAEKFAKRYGLQYDNGKKQIIGYDIDNVDDKVDWIVSNYITDDMTARQKINVLNSWLATNAEYDDTYSNYSADGVLLKGTDVCQSYALAFEKLLKKAGIECIYIRGYLMDPSNGHAWNLVRVNGQWYHVDTTGTIYTTAALIADERRANIAGWDKEAYLADINKVGWVELNRQRFYYDGRAENGGRVTGWLEQYNNWYYFDQEGVMVTGEVEIDGVLQSFNDYGRWLGKAGEWVQTAQGWQYQQNGVPITGWKKISNQWYWFDRNGLMADGWKSIDGNWYYFSSGAMSTGWLQIGSNWYLFNENGTMYTGWIQSGDAWYLLTSDGVMATGWSRSGDVWYYFGADGTMKTGWQKIGSQWYYFDDGAMKTGWLEDGESWYWFDSDGIMATGWAEINGQWEMFADSGAWMYTWDGN